MFSALAQCHPTSTSLTDCRVRRDNPFTIFKKSVALTIRESFEVRTAPDRAWRFLTDPSQVVRCLPGAELTETVDDRTYRGKVKVRVGPITTAYDGTATLTEVNEEAGRMQLVGEGREVGSSGSARMKMTGTVSGNADGGCLIEVDATIDIAGRVMQFGRGMVESISRQLFRQFADAVREALEDEAPNGNTQDPTAAPAASSGTAEPTPPTPELRVLPMMWSALLDSFRRFFRIA